MTWQKLLDEGTWVLEAAGVPDAKRDAGLLLFHSFGIDQAHFLMDRDREPEAGEKIDHDIGRFRELIRKRSRRIPLQHLLGTWEFMGLEFIVNEHVLIPRQDTESLVELVLGDMLDRAGLSLLDLCTGSGCIAVSLAALGNFGSVTGTDISSLALMTARKNADRLLPPQSQITFLESDLFEGLPKSRKFDVIVSNPPYIPTAVIEDLEPEVRCHEPLNALDGGGDGLSFYRRIASECRDFLADGGWLYLEIGWDQGSQVSQILQDEGFYAVQVCRDQAGKDRIVKASLKVCLNQPGGYCSGGFECLTS